MISNDLYYNVVDIYVSYGISFVITLMFVYIFYIYSNAIDSFMIGHNKESFILNIISRFKLSIIISMPFIMAFYLYLSELFDSEFINFVSAVIISMNILLIIRLLSNPTERLMRKKIKHVEEWAKYSRLTNLDEYVIDVYWDYKKKVSNFFYTLLYGALFLIYIRIILSLIYAPYFSIRVHSDINIYLIIYSFSIYITSIFIFVVLGEMILRRSPIIIDEMMKG